MVVCAAIKCTNSSRIKQMRFFKFPSEEKRRKTWMEKCSLENEPGPFAKLCEVHFEENQFELHRQDGWKKLKPNAIPTLFPEPVETPRRHRERKASRKFKRSPSRDSDEDDPKPRKKVKRHKKCSVNHESSSKRSNCKKCGTRSLPDGSQSAQKENVSPRRRKGRPRKLPSPVVESSSETEIEEESEDQAEHEIAQLRRENESMRQEIAEFEKHNKAMSRVIVELEKHNKAMAFKLQELDKDNKVMTKKLQDLEKQNEDLRAKLNCCFSEEQFARMEKLMQLGKIERYIPGIK